MIEKISISILPLMILIILTAGMLKKVPVYEEFVEGAKDGFKVSISIIPYLVALIVAISMFRASGALEWISGILPIQPDLVPLMITRSLSGSAALGIFSEIAANHGAEDFLTKLAAIMVGSSETTFYVLTVYFGSVGIKKFKYAVLTGVIADVTGILLSMLVARLFFPASIG